MISPPPLSFSFIEFGTVREACAAIQMLNNFEIETGLKLNVKVSETKEDREKRMAKKKDEEEFLSTLRCSKYESTTGEQSKVNGYELTSEEMKHCEHSPFLPSYKPREPVANSPQEPCGSQNDMGQEGGGAKGFSLGSSAGALSLQAMNMGSPNKSVHSLPSSSTTPSSNKSSLGPCTMCGKECKMKCQRCKALYCSKKCQINDWDTHRHVCYEKSGVDGTSKQQHQSSTSDYHPSQKEDSPLVIREKEDSDNVEGFDIPTPPLDDIIDLMQSNKMEQENRQKLQKKLNSIVTPTKDQPYTQLDKESVTPDTPERSLSLPIVVPNPHTPPSSSLESPIATTPVPTEQPPSPLIVHTGCKPIPLPELLDMFQSRDFPLPSLPLGCKPPQRFYGVVTSALSCARFSVILMSVEAKQALNTLMECGSSIQLLPIDPLCLGVGSKVGYLDQNNHLYRMEVTKILTDNVELRYYDFGGSLRVLFSHHSLVTLPEEIITIPCLRYRCTINQLQARDFVGIDYVMNLTSHHPVKVSNLGQHRHVLSGCVYYNCEVHFLDGTPLSQLVVQFLEKQVPSTSPESSVISQPTFYHTPHSANNPLSLPASAGKPAQSLGNMKKESGYKLMHMAKDVPIHTIPSEQTFTIIPCVVDSPSSFWARVKHPSLHILEKMERDLNQRYSSSNDEVYSPSVGELCVVRYCQDQRFYRAEVICVNNNGTVDVRFVDSGRREMVLVSQIRHIEPVFLTLPIQAIHFSLSGVAPRGHALSWGDSERTYLKNTILNQEVMARLVEKKTNINVVSLSDLNNQRRLLADTMINSGWCVRASDQQSNNLHCKIAGVKTTHVPPSPLSSPHTPPLPSPPLPHTPPYLPPSPPPPQSSEHQSPQTPPTNETVNNTVLLNSPRTPNSLRKHREDTQVVSLPRGPTHGNGPVIPYTSLPCDVDILAIVSSVISPAQFHIQKFDKKALFSLATLTKELNQIELVPIPNDHVYCVAKYIDDGMYYRGKIMKRNGSQFSVKFVDYGNIEEVAMSDVYAIPEKYATLPAQGVICTLQGFRQVGKRDQEALPSQQCIRDFKSLIDNKQVNIRVKMVVDSNPFFFPKHIVEVTDENGKSALNEMMMAGHVLDERGSPKKQRRGGGSGGSKRNDHSGKYKDRGRGSGNRRDTSDSTGAGGLNRVTTPSRPWGTQTAATVERISSLKQPEPCVASADQGPPSLVMTSPNKNTPQSPNYHLLSRLPVTELPSDKEYVEVVVTDFSNPQTVYLQIASEQGLQSVSNLQTSLNSRNLSSSSSHLPPPSEGEVCCCKFSEDGMWYRAVVIQRLDRKCAVKFIDFGNQDTVPFENIIPCPTELLDIPVSAVKCTLFGVHPPPPTKQWSPEAVSYLQEKCCERTLLAKVESRHTHTGVYSIKLIDTSGDDADITIADELINAGLAVAVLNTTTSPVVPQDVASHGELSPPITTPTDPQPSSLPSQPKPSCQSLSISPVTHLPAIILPEEDEFDVLVLSVNNSLTGIYIHPVSEDTPHVMSQFMNSITEYCVAETTPLTTPPLVGHYCLALFSDGSWFRAKVEAVNSASESVDVLFVDYGNRESVSMTHIRPMPAQFANLPTQTVRCSLYGIEPRSALEPDPTACSLLNQLSTTSKMRCRIICSHPLLVDLIIPSSGHSVRDELTSAGKLPPLSPDAIFSVQSSSLVSGTKTQALVTEVRGPNNFWIQSIKSPDLIKLPLLMNKINTYCTTPNHSPSRTLVLGELCCAKFSEDDVWYRGRVIEFTSLTEYSVQFLDYGNIQSSTMSILQPITADLLTIPALAIHCALYGWEEKTQEDEEIKTLTENASVEIDVKECKNRRAIVELIGPQGPIM